MATCPNADSFGALFIGLLIFASVDFYCLAQVRRGCGLRVGGLLFVELEAAGLDLGLCIYRSAFQPFCENHSYAADVECCGCDCGFILRADDLLAQRQRRQCEHGSDLQLAQKHRYSGCYAQ